MNTFELLVWQYLSFVEFTGYNFVIIFLFAIGVGALKKVDFRMQRGTYFLNSAFVVFGVSIGQCIWFFLPNSIVGDYVFVIVLIDILIWALTAYVIIVLAKARSNDAYGNSSYAALAFIPFVSLWLIFKPSKDDYTTKMPSLLSGNSAAFIGLVVLVVGRVVGDASEQYIGNQITNNTNFESQVIIGQKFIEYYAKTDGVERALEYYKTLEEPNIGEPIDDITMFKSLEIFKNTMTYKYLISDNSITGFTQEQRDIWQSYICNEMSPILEYGGKIVLHYYSVTVPTLAYVSADKEVCDI
jgi:hypothetical protein